MRELVGGKNTISRTAAVLKSPHKATFTFFLEKVQKFLRIDTAELHRVYDNMLQRAQKCIDEQGDHFLHLL